MLIFNVDFLNIAKALALMLCSFRTTGFWSRIYNLFISYMHLFACFTQPVVQLLLSPAV